MPPGGVVSHNHSSGFRKLYLLAVLVVSTAVLVAVPGRLVAQPVPPDTPGATATDEDVLPPLPDLLEPDPTLPSFDDSSPATTAAIEASSQGRQPLAATTFSPQLAASFSMIGDFFGRGATEVTVGDFYGIAVHHTIASGSAFADNDLHLITLDPGIGGAVFVGGPAGLVPGSFFLPSSAPPLPGVVDGLTLNSLPNGTYTAVETGDTTDVYDNPANPNPSIPDATIYNVFQTTTLLVPGLSIADFVGRVRIQDNNAALPRDRIIFDYNFFHNVPLTRDGVDVSRFTPGIEKTFWDGMASVEVRVPMAVTLSSDATLGTAPDASRYEFGNVVVIPKVLLTSNRNAAIAAGIGISLPTANDVTVFNAVGQPLLGVTNESVHLVPYVAMTYAPANGRYFSQVFVTVDVDANGNSVAANLTGNGLQNVSVWNDQTLLSASGSVGRYLYRNTSRSGRLRSLACSLEVHYTGTMEDAETISAGAFRLGNPHSNLSLLNGTVGSARPDLQHHGDGRVFGSAHLERSCL